MTERLKEKPSAGRDLDGKIIDSHQHVNWHGRNCEELIQDMDEHGIAVAWLLTWLIEPDDPLSRTAPLNPVNVRLDGSQEGITLREIVEAKEKNPNRFVVGYCPDPRWSGAPLFLENAHRMHNALVCGEWKYRMLFDDPRCLEVFRVAGSLKMPVVLHLDVPYLFKAEGPRQFQSDWYGGTIANLERALQECPETIFIGHAPGFWREISADAETDSESHPFTIIEKPGQIYRLLDAYPNLYADLSAGSGFNALKRGGAHAMRFLSKYSHRLLFGRDCYGGDLQEFLNSLDLPREALANIYYRTAESLVDAP